MSLESDFAKIGVRNSSGHVMSDRHSAITWAAVFPGFQSASRFSKFALRSASSLPYP